ncbi:FAD/NAD(P)-binding domain-containing protein [Heliocybe sulcata]|uniref:FAD/NAD(P)-binding domain-containing protein n=1 Tax=Heliocybe sulcata TaxID=5364 RepID=A0A5C3MS58_9AGAM|nr:FAD/NAD(P)-binding domain-containing protein [Heliocybe sulcata]
MPAIEPPKRTQILVVGGGPAGSYAAAALAREGFQVVLMEAAKFPRYHIGESLIPSVRHYLKFIGAEEKVAQYGFAHKPGSAIKFNQFDREGYTDFVALGHQNSAWNVVRSEFDNLLLQHAASCGVQVFERTRVDSLMFAPSSPCQGDGDDVALGRPFSATYVTSLADDPVPPSSPTSPTSSSSTSWGYFSNEGDAQTISFDYLVDATGRAGLMCTKYLKNRKVNKSLKNIATWGYWRNTNIYSQGTARENAPWFEALSDESGWAWFIPLHNGLTSIGVVMDQKCHTLRSRSISEATPPPTPQSPTFSLPLSPTSVQTRRNNRSSTFSISNPRLSFLFRGRSETAPPDMVVPHSAPPTTSTFDLQTEPPSPAPSTTSHPSSRRSNLTNKYLESLKLAPGVMKLIGDGFLVGGQVNQAIDPDAPIGVMEDLDFTEPLPGMGKAPVKSASDWSYSAACYAGEGWRVAGDAGAFIDPFFSSGIHLACTGGLSAATTIAASIRGDCEEKRAAEWHNARVTTSYTRFLVVVLSAYKQMRSQCVDALADVGEHNFEQAFGYLRPVIQGSVDMGPHLSPTELQRALDFCVNLFSPTTPEEHAKVSALLKGISSEAAQDVLDVTKPMMDGQTLHRVMADLKLTSDAACQDTGATYEEQGGQRSSTDEEEAETVKMVLDKVNARRVIHTEHSGISGFEEEALVGFVARLVKGRLGLAPAL